MKLSNRMKKILFLLSKNNSMTRNNIVYAIERERWNGITKASWVAPSERLLIDRVRVSYDKTLKRLRELGFVEGGSLPNLVVCLPTARVLGEDICIQ